MPDLVERFFNVQQGCGCFMPTVEGVCDFIDDIDELSGGGMMSSEAKLVGANEGESVKLEFEEKQSFEYFCHNIEKRNGTMINRVENVLTRFRQHNYFCMSPARGKVLEAGALVVNIAQVGNSFAAAVFEY